MVVKNIGEQTGCGYLGSVGGVDKILVCDDSLDVLKSGSSHTLLIVLTDARTHTLQGGGVSGYTQAA